MNDIKPRVLVATHIGEPVGGITINYRNLIASTYSKRLDVRVVETSQGRMSFSQRGALGIATVLNALQSIRAFWGTLQRERPQLVHIDSAYGTSFLKHGIMALVAHWMHVVVVLQLHCSITRLLPAQRGLWRRYVLMVLKRADGIVTLSREWDALETLLPGTRVCYVPNAIDVSPYRNLPRPRADQTDQVNILFLGHIGHEKGCFDLLDAMELVREQTKAPFCVHFVGETLLSGEKDAIRAQVEVRGLQKWAHIHEPAYGEQKIAHFRTCDIFTLPSHHEGMPMAVIEAMAAGLPVVASRVGGIPEQVVPEQTGLLVEAGDVLALTEALLRLIENPDERLRMGLAGRQRAVEQFDIEIKVEKLISFYHQLMIDRSQ